MQYAPDCVERGGHCDCNLLAPLCRYEADEIVAKVGAKFHAEVRAIMSPSSLKKAREDADG